MKEGSLFPHPLQHIIIVFHNYYLFRKQILSATALLSSALAKQ